MYQRDKFSDSKVKFRQASNRCKRFLEATKFAYAIPPLFNGQEVLSSASDKAKLFVENLSKDSNFDNSGMSLPVFPSITNLKLHNISVTFKMVKKVIMNLNLSKASGPDFIPVVFSKEL